MWPVAMDEDAGAVPGAGLAVDLPVPGAGVRLHVWPALEPDADDGPRVRRARRRRDETGRPVLLAFHGWTDSGEVFGRWPRRSGGAGPYWRPTPPGTAGRGGAAGGGSSSTIRSAAARPSSTRCPGWPGGTRPWSCSGTRWARCRRRAWRRSAPATCGTWCSRTPWARPAAGPAGSTGCATPCASRLWTTRSSSGPPGSGMRRGPPTRPGRGHGRRRSSTWRRCGSGRLG